MAHGDRDEVVRFPLGGGATEVAGLVAIIRRLSIARSLDEIMAVVTHGVRTLLQADGATFVLRDGDRCYYADEDAISPLWKGRRFPMSACISGWCMTHRQQVALPDIYKDTRIPADAYRPTFVHSLAMVPVGQDEPMAALGAYWSEVREIRPEELELLQTVANAAALAVAYVQLQQVRRPGSRLASPMRAQEVRQPARQPARQLGAAPNRAKPAPGGASPSFWATAERLRREGLRPNAPEAYAFAILCAVVATLVRLGVGAVGVSGLVTYATYYPAVLIAALAGGARSGLLASVSGALLAYWAIVPPQFGFGPLDAANAINLSLYLLATGVMVWGLDRYRRAVRRLTDEDARHFTLAREMHHRVQNMLFVVEGIVRQSLRDDPGRAQTISQRIRAGLTDIDIRKGAASEATSLHELLTVELQPFDLARFTLEGEDATPLVPEVRSLLALAAHELATNALKYGALSVAEGRVTITWRTLDGRTTIRWAEAGGPLVQASSKRGYGSVLLRRLLDARTGTLTKEYRPSGLVAEITLPLPPPRRG